MSWRFRKSLNLGRGVRLNFNKKSAGISFGTKGARYSINSNGRKTVSFGIPGTGLYWTESKSGKIKGSKSNNKSSSCLMWLLFWPVLIVFYIFYYLIKGIIVLVKKIIEK